MKISQKIYWKIANFFSARLYTLLHIGSGVLKHRHDDRDLGYEMLSAIAGYRAKYETFSFDNGLRFTQNPFNICVYASRAQLRSMQDGIHYSVRWLVKNARRMGHISGNGWSSLRGGNEVAHKVGYLPYEFMPDEIQGLSFEEYSAWTPEDEALLPIAARFKSPKYYSVNTRYQAINAIENGYALFTAGKWSFGMNNPQPPKFILEATGRYLGGHAYGSCGYRGHGDDFETPQTFGINYGQEGKAWIDDLFGSQQYAIYVEEHLPVSAHVDYLLRCRIGKPVKGSGPTIYVIENGTKRPFTTWERYEQWCAELMIEPKNFYSTRDDALALIPDGDIIL